jgi:hypothetical protein
MMKRQPLFLAWMVGWVLTVGGVIGALAASHCDPHQAQP